MYGQIYTGHTGYREKLKILKNNLGVVLVKQLVKLTT